MTAAPLDVSAALAALQDATFEAGKVALELQSKSLQTTEKSDNSVVSNGDYAAEKTALQILGARYPSTRIISEETPVVEFPKTDFFVIDPIDGTAVYVSGGPLWGVLGAYVVDGEAVAGVVYQPALKRTIVAAKGQGCFCNERRLPLLDGNVSLNKFSLGFEVGHWLGEHLSVVPRLAPEFRYLRSTGAACDGIADFALGYTIGYLHPYGAKVWDFAPGAIIARELGGVALDMAGNQMRHRATGCSGVITRSDMHARKILDLCKSKPV